MNGYLLDACALIALLNDEPGADMVEMLLGGDVQVFMSIINVLEVAYDAVRRSGQSHAARQVLELAREAGIQILGALAEAELLAAAQWKARGRLSLADAVALGIAEVQGLVLVSADHHELDSLVDRGLVRVAWVR